MEHSGENVLKILTVVGARPQFIKCAPVSRSLKGRAEEVLVHTGQHYDANMSAVFFSDLGITEPKYNLAVGSGTHGEQTGEMLCGIERVLLSEKPDRVLVYGDTNSTLAGALAAAKLNVPVAHVEAGLRSFNRRMPEEINRVLADHVSDLLFCPTDTAVANLRAEGITGGVYLTGDVMYDALVQHVMTAREKSTVLGRLGLEPRGFLLATVHRAENTDQEGNLSGILGALADLATEGRTVVFPVHPRTAGKMKTAGLAPSGLRMIEPVSYLDMLRLEESAALVLTDSGGIQKEAAWLGTPCVTLREETEWPETVKAGWNRLTGVGRELIISAVRDSLGASPREPLTGAGGGHAAEEIVRLLTGRGMEG
jgi:UDP-N-acetylglucosamine 2-epimerase